MASQKIKSSQMDQLAAQKMKNRYRQVSSAPLPPKMVPVLEHNRNKPPATTTTAATRNQAPEKETWANLLLSNNSSDKLSKFGSFDPLRTVHFLANELEYKLKSVMPDNNTLIQMVSDIQHALKRVPPDLPAMMQKQEVVTPAVNYAQNSGPKPPVAEAFTQTPPTLAEDHSEKIKQIVEKNTLKLETSCKELEKICSALQNDKSMLENQVKVEQENVLYLKQQLRESELKIDDLISGRLLKLQQQNDQLQSQINKLTVEMQSRSSMIDYNKVLSQKNKMEDEFSKLKHQKTILEMENEKFVALLHMREREIDEYHEEMKRYKQDINTTLSKLQGDFFQFRTEEHQNYKKAAGANVNSATSGDLPDAASGNFRELPSGDGSDLLEDYQENIQNDVDGKCSNVDIVQERKTRIPICVIDT